MKFVAFLYLLLCSFVLAIIPIECALTEEVDTTWVRRYNGPGDAEDEARSMAVDRFGNCYVTGYSDSRNQFPYDTDYATIKYLPNGDTAWVRRYSGWSFYGDVANDLVLDKDGNVIVTGGSILTDSWPDFLTIKYTPDGDTIWTRSYDAPGYGSHDEAVAVACDPWDNIIVTGTSPESESLPSDYLTIKYYPNGDTAWLRRFNGYGAGIDYPEDVATDMGGNVFVTGYSSGTDGFVHILTIKYDSLGNQLWIATYNGPFDGEDRPTGLAVDSSGNAFICGYSMGLNEHEDYVTIKYNSYGGEVWAMRYDGPTNLGDLAQAIAIDSSGNVIVTGYSYDLDHSDDIITIKYYPDGDTAWMRRYDGLPWHSLDRAAAIAIDFGGNIYITGYTFSNQNNYPDYLTLKYNPDGNLLWSTTYSNPSYSNNQDYASAIALDDSGHVFVTGWSQGNGSGYDYATIKYYQYPSGCFYIPGDANGNGAFNGIDVSYMVNFLKGLGGPPPDTCNCPLHGHIYSAADANASCQFNGIDVTYSVNYLKGLGPAPLGCPDCPPAARLNRPIPAIQPIQIPIFKPQGIIKAQD
jgi:uncharacterized delta-60 repeat protein